MTRAAIWLVSGHLCRAMIQSMQTPAPILPKGLNRTQRNVFEALQKQVADLEGNLTASHGQVEELEVQVDDLEGQIAVLKELTERQESLIRELHAARFGRSSEKLTPDERQLVFEDLEVALAQTEEQAAEAEQDAPSGTQHEDKKKKKRPQRNLGNLPQSLPRIEQVIEPESTECPCGCGQMHKIGEDRTERLDIIPAQVQVIVTVRPKYACRSCSEGVTQAAAPAHLVEGGLPTEGAIAHVLITKYADHCPLYRQSQILKRSDLDIHRSTLAGWGGTAAFHLV